MIQGFYKLIVKGLACAPKPVPKMEFRYWFLRVTHFLLLLLRILFLIREPNEFLLNFK